MIERGKTRTVSYFNRKMQKKCKTDAYFRLHFIIKKLVPLNKLLTLRLFSIFVTEKRRTKFQYYFKENIFKVLRYFNLGAKL